MLTLKLIPLLKIIEIEQLNEQKGEITFYTLLPVDDENQPTGEPSAFEDFIDFMNRQTDTIILEEFKAVRLAINDYLPERGAEEYFFRDEENRSLRSSSDMAKAFPRHNKLKEVYPVFVYDEENQNCRIRLYCIRVDKHILILLNGALKTPNIRSAQDCPKVKPYFDFCNQVAIAVNKYFEQGEVAIIDDEDGYPILDIKPNTRLNLCLPSRNS
jgi:hypothetical protein